MPKELKNLYILHILNDGFQASLLLLLPFIAADLQIDQIQVGILGSTLNILHILLAIPAGYLAIKFGSLKLLLFALLLYGIGYLGTAFSPNYFFLIPVFLFTGIGFGLFHPVAFALVAKLSDKSERGKLMGNFTAVGDVGRIGISSVITFIIVYIGWRTSALLQAGIALTLFFYLFYFVINKHTEKITENKVNISIKEFIKNKRFLFTAIAGFFDSFASSALFIFLPFLLLYRGVDPKVLGSFTAAFFFGNFLGKAVLGRLVDTFGTTLIFILSEICMALFIVVLANTPSFLLIIVSSVILGMFTKGTAPVIQTMISESVEHHGNYEKAYGLNALILGTSATLAPIALGFLSEKFGIVSALNMSAIFALVAIIPALGFKLSKLETLKTKKSS